MVRRMPKRPSRPPKPKRSPRPAPSARPPAARKKPVQARREEVERVPSESAFPLEIDPRQIEETLAKLKDQVVNWTNKGRYTRVRFKFRGKQLLPDLPLAAVVAAEGLTFYWGGILRALLVNFAGKTVFDVELVNDSEKRIQRGKEELLQGELDKALACFKDALAMDRDNPNVHLNLGVALKLKGDLAGARDALLRARGLDPEGAVGAEAERILSGMSPPGSAIAPGSSFGRN